VKRIPQGWQVIARFIAVANGLSRWQLTLLDPGHEVPGPFIGSRDLLNPRIKEDALRVFGRSAKSRPVRFLTTFTVSDKCPFAFLVPPRLGTGGEFGE
jgi:hypothetical protein